MLVHSSEVAQTEFNPAYQYDDVILRLWRGGNDTAVIAQMLSVKQAPVANRLARLRDAGALSKGANHD